MIVPNPTESPDPTPIVSNEEGLILPAPPYCLLAPL